MKELTRWAHEIFLTFLAEQAVSAVSVSNSQHFSFMMLVSLTCSQACLYICSTLRVFTTDFFRHYRW